MSEIKLLRCPFCGGEAELLKGQCEIDNYVMCLECRSKTKLYNTKASAIKAWNTRKPMQNIVKRLKKKHEESTNDYHDLQDVSCLGGMNAYRNAIEIVKEEGGLNE